MAGTVILSTTAVFIRYLTQTYRIPALVLACWRLGFTALTVLVVLGLARPGLLRVRPRDVHYLLLYGLLLAVFNGLWTLSVALNGAAVATVLVYCSAGFTALLGWWFLRERLGWAKLLAVALCLGGVILVSGVVGAADWRSGLPGISLGTLSGLGYAGYSLMGRSASQRGLNPWTTLFYTFGFAALFMLMFNLTPALSAFGGAARSADLLWLGKAWVGWGMLFLLAAGPTVAGFGLYNVSLVYLPSSVANLVATMEPAYTAVIAYFLLGERMGAIQVLGGVVILAGVVFLRLYEGRSAGNGRTPGGLREPV